MTFEALMDKLLNQISASNFNSITLKDLNEKSPDFWKQLLYYLQNEVNYLNHSYIRNNDDITGGTDGTSSVIGRIDELADLSENAFDNFINNIKQYLDDSTDTGVQSDYKGYFWNESVNKLISYILLHFDSDIAIEKEQQEGNYSESDDGATVEYGGIPTSGYDFRIFDMKNADAGRAFNNSPHTRWVRPWYNIDGDSYGKVRGSDKILSVLGNKDNLQFTHTEGENEWIRLIMPKYTRTVEIEDLNRNFWVIGQVITAISAYLFEEKSPIFEVLERITKEIMQLWENIMYLWLAFALISQKPYYTKLHKEIVVVNSRDFFGDIRYDDFTNSIADNITVEAAWNKISYLKDTYPECNLCIIPKIRLNNYEHNYYSKERYPGAVLYNRNTDTTTFIHFSALNIPSNSDISCEDYIESLTAIMNTKENYKWIQPASEANGYPDNDAHRYHSFIRTEGEIEASFDISTNKITFSRFTLKLYDGGKDIISDYSIESRQSFQTIRWISNSSVPTNADRSEVPPTSEVPTYNSDNGVVNYGKGYYLGDVISYPAVSLSLGAVNVEEVKLTPIGGPHWNADWITNDEEYKKQNPYSHGGRWDLVTQSGKISYYNEMINNLATTNINIINKYIDNEYTSTGNGIKLFVGARKCDLYLDDIITEKFKNDYWYQVKINDNYQPLNENNCQIIPDDIKEAYSKQLAGYYYLDDNGNLQYTAPNEYAGAYFEMDKYDGDFHSTNITRYLLPEEKITYQNSPPENIDAIESVKHGYLINADGQTILDQGKIIRLEDEPILGYKAANVSTYASAHESTNDTPFPRPWYKKISGTKGINLTYKIGQTNTIPQSEDDYTWRYRHMMLRYNHYRQTNYRGAILVIPDGTKKKKYTYPQFHHLYTLIPLKQEFSQHYKPGCLDNDDLCAQSVTFDTSDRTSWGRKRFEKNYSYTFVKRGEQMGKDNWFILYVQVCGTFRAFDAYYALQTIDSEESATYDFKILYDQSGFNNLNSLNSQTDEGFDDSILDSIASFEEDRTIPEITSSATSQDKSKRALQSIKAQYMLDTSNQDSLIEYTGTEENKNYIYADHIHIYRDGFTNVSLCSYLETAAWYNMKTAPALAAFIAKTIDNNGVFPRLITFDEYQNNRSELNNSTFSNNYDYYRKPSNAAKWLAQNITIDQGQYAERRYKIAKESEREILSCVVEIADDTFHIIGNVTGSAYLGALMWQAKNLTSTERADIETIYKKVHLYERMKPTITQVRCHIFTPDGGYARYEKDCINDYGEIRGRWKEQCPVGKSIWGKYSAAIEDATESFNSTFVRYDDNYYYYDFYHDPHQGKPDLPIPNKTTQG